MTSSRHFAGLAALFAAALAFAGPVLAQPKEVPGVVCHTPPDAHCYPGNCPAALFANLGNAVEPKTGRPFFLDYPCDLKPGEKVTFILSLHGAGSIGNWQRHYFPAMDYVEKYRLVVATPTAGTVGPPRMWLPAADDTYLENVAQYVIDQFGKDNIRSFWLAGHSQGGMTSNRIVCNDYFKDRVDGWLSLSGGRIGPAQLDPHFFGAGGPPGIKPGAAPAVPGGLPGARPGVAITPTCDINYIFETGQDEIVALPDTSPWADKYGCAARVREADVVDDKAGWVDAGPQKPGAPVNPAWGRNARPGTAEIFVYPSCHEGKLVADVMRLDKGHTEGLEPNVTETLIKLMVSAPGGKLQTAG